MKKLMMLVVVLVGGGGGYYLLAYGKAPDPPQIAQAAITGGDIVQQIQTTGVLEPVRTTPVGSQVSGIVTALHADFNSIVRKGQVVAELDRSLFQVQVDVQNANYERQVGEIGSQEVQLEDVARQLERARALFEKSLVTQQQLDQAELAVRARTSALDSARKQLLSAKASLDQAQLNLSYTTIRSPLDGVVISREVDLGQTVQSSMNVAQFFTLATDLRQLKLTASVDEAEIGHVRPGMPVMFSVDAYPRERFTGTVKAVHLNAATTSNVVTYPVQIETDNAELKLRPGMTATVRILISTAANVLRVPNQALRFRPTSDMYAALGVTPPATTATRRMSQTATDSTPPGQATPDTERPSKPARAANSTGTVDDLFQSAPARLTAGRVWIWDEAARTLRDVPVTTGVSDGTHSQIAAGDLAVGQQVVTGVVLTQTTAQRNSANSALFGGGRGMGGPPGGFGGGG